MDEIADGLALTHFDPHLVHAFDRTHTGMPGKSHIIKTKRTSHDPEEGRTFPGRICVQAS